MKLIESQLLAKESLEAEPWNNEATLYQPFESEQILLAENASCLAVKTFLKMCNLPFNLKLRSNAEFMSPGGRMTKLPVLICGAFVVAELDPIVNLVENKGVSLTADLDADQKSDLRAYMTLAEHIFTMAELYISWMDKMVLEQVTLVRNGTPYPWPLNHIQNWRKKRNVMNQLKVYEWSEFTIDDVIDKVNKCCEQFVEKLGNNAYFYGDKPTELDAVLFGHLYIIMTTPLPNNRLSKLISSYQTLVKFCTRIDSQYFQQKK